MKRIVSLTWLFTFIRNISSTSRGYKGVLDCFYIIEAVIAAFRTRDYREVV